MRRVVVALAMAGLLGLGTPATAAAAVGPVAAVGQGSAGAAEPTPSAVADGAGRGTEVCTIRDERLIELSGMAATPTGFVVINDGTEVASRGKVFQLDNSCRIGRQIGSYPAPGQRDPEDMAIGADGSIWVADIGDGPGEPKRANIALWKFPPDLTGKATLYRLKYPDGPHDAEAILLGPDDSPIIITKTVTVAAIYAPTGPLTPSTSASQVTAMSKVGEFKPTKTSTSTPLGFIGQTQITGGANSPDRKKVVLRTYSDAYEWDVPDGDVVKAITTGKPRITPLPEEPQGEAITYSSDGSSFLTVSETADVPGDKLPTILRYKPSTGTAPPAGANAAPLKKNSLSWYERMSLTQATSLLAGVGIIGVLLVVAGVIGIMRTRSSSAAKPRKSAESADGGADEDSSPTAVLSAVRDGYSDDYGGHPHSGHPQGGYPQGGGYAPPEYDPYGGDPHGYGGGYPPGR